MKGRKNNRKATSNLPPIPDKKYFTIGEVSHLCDTKPHVLRYWEQEFPQLNPSKRRGNRRYYQRKDVIMIRHIRELLYEQGFTIGGARRTLLQEMRQTQPTLNKQQVIAMVIEDLEATLQELTVEE